MKEEQRAYVAFGGKEEKEEKTQREDTSTRYTRPVTCSEKLVHTLETDMTRKCLKEPF